MNDDEFFVKWLTLTVILLVMMGFQADTNQKIAQINQNISHMQNQLDTMQEPSDPYISESEQLDPEIGLSQEETHLVALVCMTEDNTHGMAGLRAVAQTVKNRLDDGRFGRSIADVCTVDQFHGLRKGDMTVSGEALNAVREVWTGEKVHDGLYFCTPATPASKIKRGLVEVGRWGGHRYYTDKDVPTP